MDLARKAQGFAAPRPAIVFSVATVAAAARAKARRQLLNSTPQLL